MSNEHITEEQILKEVLRSGGLQYGEEGKYIDIEIGELMEAVRAILALRPAAQPVAVPDRVPMTDELEQALEMLVEQCNQDAVLSGAQAVIHAEAVLERLYKSRTGITTPKADK